MRPLLLRLGAVALVFLAGCAKQADLPETVISAPAKEEFARFRADLGARFPGDRLQDFDTATRELQLDAMHRDIAGAEAREADMLRAIHGKTVHAATVLGWGARKARFLREIAELERMLAHDLKQPPTDAALRRIGSEREVLAQLQVNLQATETHLEELNRPKP